MAKDVLKAELTAALKSGGAHADFDRALKGFPFKDAGRIPPGVPWSAWQLLEHMRIAQADILEFVASANYREKQWPAEYWPINPSPSRSEWSESVKAFRRDRKELQSLLKKSDPLQPIPHANNKTLLNELLLVVDHNAYHLGEFVLLRKLLGNWPT